MSFKIALTVLGLKSALYTAATLAATSLYYIPPSNTGLCALTFVIVKRLLNLRQTFLRIIIDSFVETFSAHIW